MVTKRIEYIDLMKGVCIILVVLLHSGITFSAEYDYVNSMLRVLRMPLYFFLSGLFFKSYGDALTFIIKKTNSLVIPYLFFSTLFILPQSIVYGVHSCKSVLLLYLEPYYTPLWFLRCLFLMNIVYYLLHKFIHNALKRVLFCFVISLMVWYLNLLLKEYCNSNVIYYWIFYQLNTVTALFSLPFMAIADYFNSKNILRIELGIVNKIFLMLFLLLVWRFLAITNVDFQLSIYGEHPLMLFVSSVSAIVFVAIVCSLVKKLPYISYMGKYSIIVLGTHMMLLMLLKRYTGLSAYVCAFITLLLSPIFIHLIKNFFPYFTAQKQCIYVENRRVMFFKKD